MAEESASFPTPRRRSRRAARARDMTSLPPRPPPRERAGEASASASSSSGAAAFSVRDLRASLDSRVSDAKAAVQRRLGEMGPFASSEGDPSSRAGGTATSRLPSVPSLTELARGPAKQMADTVARLTPDDNALIKKMRSVAAERVGGMRRAKTADELSNATQLGVFQLPDLPGMPEMPLAPPALPEWDVFKSLKTNTSGSSGGAGSLGSLRESIEAKIEERLAGIETLAPSELLSQMHDAGNKAVHEWMATARARAESAGAKQNRAAAARNKNAGGSAARNRARSMTAEEFEEAEAAAAAMEFRIGALAVTNTNRGGDGDESESARGVPAEGTTLHSASAASAASGRLRGESRSKSGDAGTASDVATIPRAEEERRRQAAEAVSTSARSGSTRRASSDASSSKNLREPGRSVAIVTTAALPWMTGTAVNPLLRAAYLARRGLHEVTLVVPWLAPEEQRLIHPSVVFETPEEQGAYVRRWVKDRCGFEPKMRLDFYPGRYATDKYSIIPVGDVSEYITDERTDVAVLEEPEHLNWYHAGQRWSDKFDHVVGVVHTNYLEYARLEKNGGAKEAAMRFVNSWVSRVHCHKIIKLSDAVQDFPRSETVNVHGVSPVFLDVGRRKATAAAAQRAAENDPDAAAAQAVSRTVGKTVSNALASLRARKSERRARRREEAGKKGERGGPSNRPPSPPSPEKIHPSNEVFNKGCYFLGKVVWGKGFHELLQRVEEHNSSAAGSTHPLSMDVFGSGEDLDDVTREAAAKRLPLRFKGRADHASDQMHDYKVFINPSLSDVVATTTAEALAMGKYVICAEHPSNAFFSTFPNCLTYDSPAQFTECVKKALTSDPTPLTARDRYRLSWEAATDRFLDAASLGAEQTSGPGSGFGDRIAEGLAHAVHSAAAKQEPLRRAAGAGVGTLEGPSAEKIGEGTWKPPWVKKT